MADQKLSQLTVSEALTGAELAYVVQGGNSRRTTTGAIAGLAPGTSLTYDPATRLLSSSTGADVTLPLATDALDGLMSAAHRALSAALIAAGISVTGSTVTIPHIHGDMAGSLYIHVKNLSGGTLTKGTPVRVVGAVGDTSTLEVAAADAANAGTMPAVGILSDTLAVNGTGHAVVAGELLGMATGGYSVGQALYVASGGGLTIAKPISGTIQQVAIVGRVNASTGSITVTIGSLQSPNWDTAYSERLRWDGGATGMDAATGRTSLGLGSAAQGTIGTAAGNVVALDGAARLPAVDGSQLTGLSAAFDPASPGAIGGTTPAAGAFTRLTLPAQGSAPSTPASGFSFYANSSNALSWVGANGFRRTFDGTANTADRTYVLPDAPGTIATAETTLPRTIEFTDLAYAATINIDFNAYNGRFVVIGTLTGNLSITFSNIARGRQVTVILTSDTTARNLTFPATTPFGGPKPSNLAASKTMSLSLTVLGSGGNDAAVWAVALPQL